MNAAPTNALEAIRAESPCVLIVDDQADLIELFGPALGSSVHCRLLTAATFQEARHILLSEPIDLMVVDLYLPDGRGDDLMHILRKRNPLASAVVITGAPSIDSAVSAMRQGAVDFLAKPFTVDEFLERVRTALARHVQVVKNENRIERLRSAVRRLNDARRVVTKKVDLLCNDLVSAYGDLSRQLDQVRTTESFRGAITSAHDLEQMLCHAMDWMLRQIGYANVAVWLAGDNTFQLGAYMKHTIPGEPPLVDAMSRGLLGHLVRDTFIHWSPAESEQKLSSAEKQFLKNQTILAAHCTYLGESLAHIVLFRDGEKHFTEEDETTLRAIAPIFAVTLATMVKQHPDEEEHHSEDSGPLLDDDGPNDSDAKKKRPRKKDDADWWKHGENPPF